MYRKLLLVLISLMPLWGCYAVGFQPLLASQAFQLSAKVDEQNQVLLHWKIDSSSYLYRDHIQVKVLKPKAVNVVTVHFPPGERVDEHLYGAMEVYLESVTVPVLLNQSQNRVVTLKVSYQGCSKTGVCYPPVNCHVVVNFKKQLATVTHQAMSEVRSRQDHIALLLETSNLWWVTIMFVGFGLLLAFTPCILPMIPILSSIVVGQRGRGGPWHAFILSLIYVFAMAFTYAIAGVIVGLLGKNIQAVLQTPWVISIFSLIFVVLACSMFGLYELQWPSFLREKLMATERHQQGGTYFGVAVMGILATLVVSPCVTPPLIGALIYIAKTGNAFLGGLALFSLGIGMGIPLLLIGTLGDKYLPKTGPWMVGVKRVFGFVLLLMAIYLVSRVVPTFVILVLVGILFVATAIFLGEFWKKRPDGLMKFRRILSVLLLFYGMLLILGGAQGNTRFFNPLAKTEAVMAQVHFVSVKSYEDVQRQLIIAKQLKKPVMLDFYASWCIACKEMDAATFQNSAVQNSLQQFIVLRADVTANDSTDKMLAQQYGVVAPPSFVFFNKEGQWMPDRQIVGAMNAEQFDRQLQALMKSPEFH